MGVGVVALRVHDGGNNVLGGPAGKEFCGGGGGKVRGILWWVLSVGSDVANTPGCVHMSSYPHQISGCRSA